MQRTVAALLALGTIAVSTAARAQSPPAPPPFVEVQPVGPEPTFAPPPPPPYHQSYQAQAIHAPAPVYQPAPVAAPVPAGQWVYTQQYGWLWMPYGPGYTTVTSPTVAHGYVYYPARGWRWVSAPWVLGLGRAPHWGRLGPRHYAWHGGWNRPAVVHAPSRRQVVVPRAHGRVVHVNHRAHHHRR